MVPGITIRNDNEGSNGPKDELSHDKNTIAETRRPIPIITAPRMIPRSRVIYLYKL
jgi:hypothetical protein